MKVIIIVPAVIDIFVFYKYNIATLSPYKVDFLAVFFYSADMRQL